MNLVEGNFIGTASNGKTALGNFGNGILIDKGAHTNTIGGPSPGAGNVIMFNALDGVKLSSTAGAGNLIDPNSISANCGLGIRLGDSSQPLPNDPGDADTGPNNLQNYPEVTSAVIDGNGELVITYKVDSAPANSNYGTDGLHVEFFRADGGLSGEHFIGQDSYTFGDYNNGSPGLRQTNLGLASAIGVAAGNTIVATATDADGNSSEFTSIGLGFPSATMTPPTPIRIDTPPGSGVTVEVKDATLTFTQVTKAGTTTFTPMDARSAGRAPAGYAVAAGAPAYYLTTTAAYTGEVDFCLTVASVNDPAEFAKLRLLHEENGVLVDRTVNQNFAGRRICATANSLGAFVLGTTDSPFPTPGQLQNIATRLNVLTGDKALIGGFIPTGTAPKKVVVRGIGPSLTAFGVNNALANPVLELHGPDGSILATNDNWQDDAGLASQIQAAGLAPKNDLESALVATLNPGQGYTAIVSGKDGGTGIGLAEVYDIDPAADSKLGNIATRGFIDTGDNVMIGGLILGPADTVSTKVVVRGIGPSLTAAGVNNALQDPTLEIHDSNGTTIASNDDWQTDANAAQVQAAGLAPKDPKESAIYAVLPPAAYTAIVRGANNTTGIGLVEVYNPQ